MRALALVALTLVAQTGFAKQDVVARDKLVIQIVDIRDKNMVIDGVRMVAMTGTRAEGIAWDEDGTAYLVKSNYLGETTRMRISSVGAAAQGKIWYRLWPVLLDRRGDVFVIDDSAQQDYMAKMQYFWGTWRGRLEAGLYGVGGGLGIATLGAADQASFRIFFDPTWSFSGRAIVTGAATVLVRALWDAAKSHRQLNRGANFFTRRLVANVESLTQYQDPVTQTLDVRITYKNGESRGQPEFLSQVFADKQIKYRNEDCLKFLEK